MMSNYVVCEEPEHDKFGHRKADCRECNPIETIVVVEAANPGIGLTGIGRAGLISIIETLQKENEKEERTDCRSCGRPKTVRM